MSTSWIRACDLDLSVALADVQSRWSSRPAVAAALFFKQYAWYVIDAALTGHETGLLPDLSPEVAEVRFNEAAPLMSVRSSASSVEPDFAYWLAVSVIKGHLAPVVFRLHELTRVGERTLWGSVSHAIASPMRAKGLAPEEISDFLAKLGPPVDGLVTITPSAVERRTCCLVFRSDDESIKSVCSYCPIVCAKHPCLPEE